MKSDENLQRLKVAVRGAVQGVGFRPFVYRLASVYGLRGHVFNSSEGVFIEAEGARSALESFLGKLRSDHPPRARITSLEAIWLEPAGLPEFRIKESSPGGVQAALVMPDIATCDECAAEVLNPSDRRFWYPFTNCVNCGPRFSIIEALPYDRINTSMRAFEMCPRCRAEYTDPGNRRFHAQPNACPECGPHLELWDAKGKKLIGEPGAGAELTRAIVERTVEALRQGQVVAVKGLGGFHLMADATNDAAVRALRDRKRREEKPLAVMFPSVADVRHHCAVSDAEEAVMSGPESPIVLLRKSGNDSRRLSDQLAPGNPSLGVMLPYTPLHRLLLRVADRPLVATSGNLSDEPICTEGAEAVERLSGIADFFLTHNRPIVRHVDDSIVRIVLNREMVLRRARGYAPLPVALRAPQGEASPVRLAVGAHLKNTVALQLGSQVFLSQHIGDLETDAALRAFERVSVDLPGLYKAEPSVMVADAHPNYLSTRFAQERSRGKTLVSVQHHVAHVLSCMAENEVEPPALGIAWDGTGYGPDESVWGGEFFMVTEANCKRVGRFRQFRLPGGEAAIKEPRRSAAGLLHEVFGEHTPEILMGLWRTAGDVSEATDAATLSLLTRMLSQGINSPRTSSAGRLFDAVASIVGIRHVARHEGQAAMDLEFVAEGTTATGCYPAHIIAQDGLAVLDWEAMIREIVREVQGVARGEPRLASRISATFHNTLVEWILSMARRFACKNVVLSGGCFQNVRLLEGSVTRLREGGFRPFWHQRVPPNDGGIALGQIIAAERWPTLLPDGSQTAESPSGARPDVPN